jgi:hypothetical protein
MKPSSASFVLAFSLLFRHFVQLQIYTRPAGGLSPAGHFISLLRMYSLSINFTCLVKSLSLASANFSIFSIKSGSIRIVFVIVSLLLILSKFITSLYCIVYE